MKRVFLSFLAEDSKRVDGLRLLAANPTHPVEFYDESVSVPFDSEDAFYIKRRIREKISRTSVTVCLVSAMTHTSAWVNWEIEESMRKGNVIIMMALKDVSRAILPSAVRGSGITFHAWNPRALAKLIEG